MNQSNQRYVGKTMGASIAETNLRRLIIDRELGSKVQHIWNSAERELHPYQQGITSQDFLHSIRVEENIWKLIKNNSEKFSQMDLFLLSACAAIHDIGKIPTDSIGNQKGTNISVAEDHGEEAKALLLKEENWRKFHFDRKVEAEAVANIVAVHNNGLIDRVPEEAFTIGSDEVKLRALAAIFRLADILDSDTRRWPYLAKIIKELKFPNQIEVWVGRRTIGGWIISTDGKSIMLQGSPDNEEEKMSTLAYVDSLNSLLTPSHIKHLENCQIEYYCEGKTKNETLHFPTKFMYYEFQGALRKEIDGLKSIYNQFAVEYIDKTEMISSTFTLKGIGDFTDKKNIKVANIFVDTHVSVNVDLAPSNPIGFDWKTLSWIRDQMPKDDVTKRIQTSSLLNVPNLRRIVLLGGPGSGKSIISQYIVLDNFIKAKANLNQRNGVPFLITIRDYAFANKCQNTKSSQLFNQTSF